MAGRIGTGAGGSLGCGIEATKGVPVAAIANWLPVDTVNIGAPFDVLRKNSYWGSRHMLQVVDKLKAKVGGTFAMSAFSNAVGMPLISGTGKEIYYPAATDVVGAGGITDANGLSAIPVTNTYQLGQNITIGTGAVQECTPVSKIVGGVIYTKQLRATTPRVAGTVIGSIPQRQITTRGWTDAEAWECPTLELEKNVGRQFAWRLNGSRILKYDVRASREDINIAFTVACTELPFRLDQPGAGVVNPYTVFNPTVYERAELTRPFTIRHSYIIVPNDQAATGVQLLSRLAEIEDVTLTWDNHGIDKDFHNDNPVKDNYLGGTSGQIQYKYSTSAGRWADWEDYLVSEYAPPVPFIWRLAVNIGTILAPQWRCCTFVVPALKIVTTQEADPLNDTLAVTVTGEVVEPVDGSPPISIWVADDLPSVYPVG